MILVIGGGSRTGRELVRLLREHGERVRVLTRSAEAAASAADPDSVVGDLARPATLDAAMAGVDQVFLLSSPAHDERAWHRNAIEAATRQGVKHLVRSSILGADPHSKCRFIRHHGESDDFLRASGVPFTIIRPNFYLHNVTAGWAPTLDPQGNYYAPAGDALISMVDARDVAAVAFAALTGRRHTGKTYDVTGLASVSHQQACEKLAERLGRPVRYVPVDDDTARSAMLGAGLPGWLTDALVELYQDYRRSGADGYAAQVTGTVYDIIGRLPISLDEALDDELRPEAAIAGGRSGNR
jgi:uncharacterized protein YbjT (DUF2867 family)